MAHREKLESEMATINAVRDRKLGEMKEAGVDPLYLVDLSKYDPTVRISQDYKLGASKVRVAAGK